MVPLDREVARQILRPFGDIDLETRLASLRVDDEGVTKNLEVEVTIGRIELGKPCPKILLEFGSLEGTRT